MHVAVQWALRLNLRIITNIAFSIISLSYPHPQNSLPSLFTIDFLQGTNNIKREDRLLVYG